MGELGRAGNQLATHLPEADLAVVVFVHLLDHGLERQVGLGATQLFHHQLQLMEVNKLVSTNIVSASVRDIESA